MDSKGRLGGAREAAGGGAGPEHAVIWYNPPGGHLAQPEGAWRCNTAAISVHGAMTAYLRVLKRVRGAIAARQALQRPVSGRKGWGAGRLRGRRVSSFKVDLRPCVALLCRWRT